MTAYQEGLHRPCRDRDSCNLLHTEADAHRAHKVHIPGTDCSCQGGRGAGKPVDLALSPSVICNAFHTPGWSREAEAFDAFATLPGVILPIESHERVDVPDLANGGPLGSPAITRGGRDNVKLTFNEAHHSRPFIFSRKSAEMLQPGAGQINPHPSLQHRIVPGVRRHDQVDGEPIFAQRAVNVPHTPGHSLKHIVGRIVASRDHCVYTGSTYHASQRLHRRVEPALCKLQEPWKEHGIGGGRVIVEPSSPLSSP